MADDLGKPTEETGWRVYGYGSVAIDKAEGANAIEVFLKDKMYGTDGEISEMKNMNITSTNSEGIVKTENIDTRKTIPARWAAINQPNRTTSPDVRKNETVLVYRYGNNDDYYWDKVFTEYDKRGKEHVSFAFKNTDDLIDINLDNSYSITFSTKHKYIHLHTSINDGEKVGYDITIDTANSILSTIDTRGNYQTLKSLEDDHTIFTNKKINLLTQDVLINASKSITINSPLGKFNITDLTIAGTKYLATNTSHTIKTSAFSLTSQAGTMTSSGSGMDFSKMLSCTDLKTNAVSSQNGHRHNETNSVTSAPIG